MLWLSFPDRLPVTGLGMVIGAGDYEPRVRNLLKHLRKCFHERFQALVCSPVSNGEDALIRVAALAEVRRRGRRGEGAVSAEQHVLCAVLAQQGVVVSGQ